MRGRKEGRDPHLSVDLIAHLFPRSHGVCRSCNIRQKVEGIAYSIYTIYSIYSIYGIYIVHSIYCTYIIQYIQYIQYIYCIQYIQYIHYTIYTVYIVYSIYSIYNIYSIYCIQYIHYTIYTVYTILRWYVHDVCVVVGLSGHIGRKRLEGIHPSLDILPTIRYRAIQEIQREIHKGVQEIQGQGQGEIIRLIQGKTVFYLSFFRCLYIGVSMSLVSLSSLHDSITYH